MAFAMDSASQLSPPTPAGDVPAELNVAAPPTLLPPPDDRAEQVRQALAARRRAPLSRDVDRELVVRNDTSFKEWLFAVVQECLAQDIPEEELWRMGDDVQLIFSGSRRSAWAGVYRTWGRGGPEC